MILPNDYISYETFSNMEQEIEDLTAECAALRADAERYRYLRNRLPNDVLMLRGPKAGVWCDMDNEEGDLLLVTGDDLDAAIDAARGET